MELHHKWPNGQTESKAHQSSMQWILGAVSLGVKRLRHEADHSPLSSVEVKNLWSCTSTP